MNCNQSFAAAAKAAVGWPWDAAFARSDATVFEWNEIYLKFSCDSSAAWQGFFISNFAEFSRFAHKILFSCLVVSFRNWVSTYRTLHVVYLSIIDVKRLLPLFVLRIKFKWNMCLWYVRQGGIEYRTRNMARCVHKHEHDATEREYGEACESEQTACHCQHCTFAQLFGATTGDRNHLWMLRRFEFRDSHNTHKNECCLFSPYYNKRHENVTAVAVATATACDALEFFKLNFIFHVKSRTKPKWVDKQM